MEETMKLIGKESYIDAPNKRRIEKIFLDTVHKTDIITTLGPTPLIPLQDLIRRGFKTIVSYEKCKDVFDYQKSIVLEDIYLFNDNIINVPLDDNYFYYMDVCGGVKTFEKEIRKLKDYETMWTLSIRAGLLSVNKTTLIDLFMNFHDEYSYEIKNNIDKTSTIYGIKYKFLVSNYTDGGNPMITFKKLL